MLLLFQRFTERFSENIDSAKQAYAGRGIAIALHELRRLSNQWYDVPPFHWS